MNGMNARRNGDVTRMPFQRIQHGSKTGFWPYVYSPDGDIRIEQMTADMPTGKVRVFLFKNGRVLFGFDTEPTYDEASRRIIYTAKLNEIVSQPCKLQTVFDCDDDDASCIAMLTEGIELLFQDEARTAAGYVVQLRLV